MISGLYSRNSIFFWPTAVRRSPFAVSVRLSREAGLLSASGTVSAPTRRVTGLDVAALLSRSLDRLRESYVHAGGTSIVTQPGTRALARGVLPLGNASTYHATRQVNEQTTTVRQSTSALGLDVTTAEAASTLAATAEANEQTTTVRQSTSVLGLDVVNQVSSTVQSEAEINTAATSYGKISMAFLPGEGTSIANLSGTYSGTGAAASATSLAFKMKANGTLSATVAARLKFDVLDQTGAIVATIDVLDYLAGTSVYLGDEIGLSVTFGAGTVVNKKETETAVSNTTPTNVDPAAIFNDADVNLRPRFENGAQVVAGSFTVNGTEITVNADDTVNAVIDRINSSVSGIAASFVDDRVTLATTSGSESDIVLAGDTSGFLAAVKLDSATTVRGDLLDDIEWLKDSIRFGAVATGSFDVNGVTISVDRDTDTLQSVLGRVNGSGAGVTAAFDAEANKLVFTPDTPGTMLVLEGDTSGFLAAANVEQGAAGTAVNADAAFNGTGMNSPLFDPGVTVTAGSFTVNGTEITVNADDTVNTVIDRINSSVSGITASFVDDRVTLATTSGSESDIVLAGDTSGFLAAVKLDSATTVRGDLHDDIEWLKDSNRFGTVATGSFDVNGVTISVDRDTDTLQSVLGRVNGSGAGVTAAFDAEANKLVFTPDTPGTMLVLEGDTSGFLAAANVEQGAAGTAVNADAAFNGTGMNSPLFDPGVTVAAGSFTVNGTEITVNADDTINGLLQRITGSGAGVTASYDPGTETVFLTNKTVGASPLTLGNDTSGFLAAVKLDGTAENKLGNMDVIDIDAVLRDQPAFSGFRNGVITLNGQSVNVSPGSSTLRGIASAVDALSGVDAWLSAPDRTLDLLSAAKGGSMTLADTSGLLDALSIPAGSYQGKPDKKIEITAPDEGLVLADPRAAADDVGSAIRAFNDVLRDPVSAGVAESALRRALLSAFGSTAAAAANGISIDQLEDRMRISVDETRLASALQNQQERVMKFIGDVSQAATASAGAVLAQLARDDERHQALGEKTINPFEERRTLSRDILGAIGGTDGQYTIAMITSSTGATSWGNGGVTAPTEDANMSMLAGSFAQPLFPPPVRSALDTYSYAGKAMSQSASIIATV